ncbi:MAG TPA: GNAT family N-acetyltransferase [Polyangiaceae bacterium]|jgi:GNAT superfamily N-acetyltransferase
MIRPARPDDVPAILGLIRALARYERLEHEVVGTEGDLREHLFGARPRAEVLLVDDAGAVVAFALFFHNYSTFLCKPGVYLEDLFVLPEHRRKGYGKALLAALARVARERGCGRFEWSVLDWNESAIAFYRSLGARTMDDWRVMRVTGNSLDALAALANG